ncbi:Uncharacterized protein, contains Zn-finger domain of CHY type [Oceanobacillus limi]|uniref:Uncharacterized protein, contains Zn-finger domain of CHY type n=2 Tax=Oceanobacillus limi TaxID=930131 RepID=A0A1I0AFR3_9BACI|nr:CHY zinc finger protein [Oceanobacillus limi]SES93007.1 Uncharacterized protein, contains Zn-finger domain of CHY type [Oceanobacillus limi]
MKFVYGELVDAQTRCKHYHSINDIIAIKFKCCNKYYPCYKCHEAAENHQIITWKEHEFSTKAILCGVCGTEHTIKQYLQTTKCLNCSSHFNEGCQLHYHLYFDIQ